MPPTCEIDPHGEWILCLKCGLKSHNENDVANKYCGFCARFHVDELDPEPDHKPEDCNYAPSTGKGHIPAIVHRSGGPLASVLNICGYCGRYIKAAHGTWIEISETEADEIKKGT